MYMAGGLLQIVTQGSQDLFLTGNPEITYFKVVYRRHTNFASEAIRINFDDNTGFGNTCNVVIPKIGDLMYRTYVEITIPEFAYTRTLDQSNIDELTDEVSKLQYNYNLVKTFLSNNMAAYRAAYALYLSNNITYSTEMINAITPIITAYELLESSTEFQQMIMDDYNAEQSDVLENGGILYRYNNVTMIVNSLSTVQLGNISLKSIQNYWPSTTSSGDITNSGNVDKSITMNIINFLIENCKKLDKKYFDKLSVAKKALEDAYSVNYKFAWVDKLGHSVIDYVEFSIGGNKIDKQYGLFLDIWIELMGKKDQAEAYNRLIGNISELTTYDRTTKPKYTMTVPLQFWFCRYSGLALPLIALQYNDVNMRIKFRKFSECAYIEGDSVNTPVSLDDILENMDINLEANLIIEYIYLDSAERRKFAQSSHEYLIEQLQINYDDYLITSNYQVDLDLEHPCIGLMWVLQRNTFLQNPDGHTKCNWTTYTTTLDGTNPVLTSQMLFNDYERVEQLPYSYFNYLQPLMHANNTPADGINSYWFALFPNEHQPSGSCNMSRLPKVRMQFTVDPFYYNNDERYTFTIYAINYNILRILGGMGNVAYV